MMIYLNGSYLPAEKAFISIQDRGYLLGDGLFETLRCYDKKPFALPDHWQRLQYGAEFLQIPIPISYWELQNTITELLKGFKLDQSIGIRITLSRGTAPRGLCPPPSPTPCLLIEPFIIDVKKSVINACISDVIVNDYSLLNRFKSLNYLEKILAIQKATAKGFNDTILLNTKSLVVSTTTANIFIVNHNTVYTPSLHDGALPGVTKKKIALLCQMLQINYVEESISIAKLLNASEIFISNSIIEISQISAISDCWQASADTIFQKIRSSYNTLVFK